MFFLLLIAVVSIAIVSTAARSTINTNILQMDLLRNRILYDPTGIVYVDELGAHPGVINRAAVNQESIDIAFNYPDGYGGARITLVSSETGDPLAIAVVNAPTFNRISTNVAASLKGGGFTRTYVYPVTIVDGPDRISGFMVIEIAGPDRA